MECANPKCKKPADNLFEGTLWLMELTATPEARITGSEEGFPICSVPSRYFWLCTQCSSRMSIIGWLQSGLILRSASSGCEEVLALNSPNPTVQREDSPPLIRPCVKTA